MHLSVRQQLALENVALLWTSSCILAAPLAHIVLYAGIRPLLMWGNCPHQQ